MYHPQVGDPLEALDTPSMIVDIALMEENIVRLMQRFREKRVHVRPHLKTVKSPELARLLLAAGAIGGCVAKVSEAEVMAQGGIEDLLITTEVVGKPKLLRLVDLVRQHPRIKVVVDSLAGAQALDQAMSAAQVEVNVLIDLNVGQNRCGVLPGEEALMLAQQLSKMSNIHLVGVQGYEGHLQHIHDPEERGRRCQQAMQALTETAAQLRAKGFPIEIVTTGGTGTAEICANCAEITEVQPGSFVFMDTDYRNALGPAYANALTILSTVISKPTPTRAVVDAGLKSLSIESGMPEPKGLTGIAYQPGGDEHGILTWSMSAASALTPLEIGDRIEFIPSHIDTTINLHDTYYAHRNGRLEAIWPVTARGKVQ
ncbi:DSD1 family PLP-dependent enzyme [Ktedonobacter robiniae]|uniref:Alanine racemase n=1 Tax=Ktedonobacter robiniae TaxID=2778365 RepID=A0ABQ3UHS3_9CHLR|nr:DSD1 family PLP-dependent enzyme [Ktedonobacter robiniae]GHO51970.1 alanine racemase [Ktedonobacter robiniae]